MSASAIAIFVKTPGLSPIKTRLAASAGAEVARAFYGRALVIIEAVVARMALEHGGVTPYWSVAERHGLADSRWQSFPTVWQGEGGLGARLARVYAELRQSHDAVLLIGADSPLLTSRHLRQTLHSLGMARDSFVIGRALDGGFYLFGGRAPVPAEVWTAVEYSVADTADQLIAWLRPLGSVAELQSLPDVDDASDLLSLARLVGSESELLPSQRALLGWIDEVRASAGLGSPQAGERR